MASDAGTTLFDYLKIKFRVDTGCKLMCPLPANIWKDYKKQWVVLSLHISPPQCYLTYCPQEDDWLMNQPSLPKLTLDNFVISRHGGASGMGTVLRGVGGSKNLLEIAFEHYTLFLEYESMSKLQSWYDQLEKIKSRTFVELIRCPEHPEREREYVLEVSSDRILFYSPRLIQTSSLVTEFEWRLDNIRRSKYHKQVGKVEVEVGRAAETGEGHFYFIGPQVKKFFIHLKDRIEELSKAASLKDRGKDLPLRSRPSESDSLMLTYDGEYLKAESPPSSGSGSGDMVPRAFVIPPPPISSPSLLSPPHSTPSLSSLAPSLSPSLPSFPFPLSSSPSLSPSLPSLSPSLPSLSPTPPPRFTCGKNYTILSSCTQPLPPPPLPLKVYETMKPQATESSGGDKAGISLPIFQITNSTKDDYQSLNLATRVRPRQYDEVKQFKETPTTNTTTTINTTSTTSLSELFDSHWNSN